MQEFLRWLRMCPLFQKTNPNASFDTAKNIVSTLLTMPDNSYVQIERLLQQKTYPHQNNAEIGLIIRHAYNEYQLQVK